MEDLRSKSTFTTVSGPCISPPQRGVYHQIPQGICISPRSFWPCIKRCISSNPSDFQTIPSTITHTSIIPHFSLEKKIPSFRFYYFFYSFSCVLINTCELIDTCELINTVWINKHVLIKHTEWIKNMCELILVLINACVN